MKIDVIHLINKGIDVYNEFADIIYDEDADGNSEPIECEVIEKIIEPLKTIDVQASFACKHFEAIALRALEIKDEVIIEACVKLGFLKP